MEKKVLNTDVLKADILEGITRHGGFILIQGTHRLEDLLCEAHDFLLKYEVNGELRKDIREVFTITSARAHVPDAPLVSDVYNDTATISEDPEVQQRASELWNLDVFDFCNRMAPEGYHFGAHEGNGSDFGWWRNEDEEE